MPNKVVFSTMKQKVNQKKIIQEKVIENNVQKVKSPLTFFGLDIVCLSLLFVLVVTTFFIYKSAFNNQFVNWDDQVYVEEQPLVLKKNYTSLWTTPISLNYHPLTMMSLALQVPKDIKKLTPKPFIQLNVWLHIFNSLLVFFLIWVINERKWVIALITASIFALHPTHVESVVWVSERKDVLYTFFFLLSSVTYWKYLNTNKKRWLGFAFLFFLFSVLSKAVAVVLPLVFILMDYWRGRKLGQPIVFFEKIPFFMVSLFIGMMAVSVQSGGDFGGLLTLYGEKTKALADPKIFSIWQKIQFAAYGFIEYIITFFYPLRIHAFYPYPTENTLKGLSGLLYPISFVGILGLTIWSSIKTRIFAFGIGFYFITVALVLQFMSVGLAIMADRYTYVPYIGLSFMLIYIGEKWVSSRMPTFKYASIGIVLLFLVFLTNKTKSQLEVWQDSEALWTQVLEFNPTEDLALANRGNHRGKTGNIDGAMLDFEKAISDGCLRADVYEGLGNSYGTISEKQGDKKESYVAKAIAMYKKALELEPGRGNVHFNLGIAQLQTNPAASVIAFTEALRLMPYKEADILPVLGLSQLNSGNYADAIKTLSKAIDSGIKTDAIFYYRGLANLGMGNKKDATLDFNQALTLNPNNEDVKSRLSQL
ncbi:MAG: tetratricopeptide repeat protein [Saprospiraceae bacterium]|nr:tetratricopeptide repeat protein [Saprospiraceae bacterium]